MDTRVKPEYDKDLMVDTRDKPENDHKRSLIKNLEYIEKEISTLFLRGKKDEK